MKVYVIVESYTDHKGGNATSFGVFATKQEAIDALPIKVIERLGLSSRKEFEKNYNVCFKEHMAVNMESWSWDRGEDIIEFYIQEDELKTKDYDAILCGIKNDMLTKIKQIFTDNGITHIDFTECNDCPIIIDGTCDEDCYTLDDLNLKKGILECSCSSTDQNMWVREGGMTLDAVKSILKSLRKNNYLTKGK